MVIDVDSGRITRLQMPPDFHRATLGDDISVNDYKWSPDASRLTLASVSRDHKRVVLRVADTATGTVRDVLEETVPTQFEARAGWRVLWATNEVVWNSERDNWSQLYLYDLSTGRLKRAITSGEGPVMQISRVDEATRMVWFGANGREPGHPEHRHRRLIANLQDERRRRALGSAGCRLTKGRTGRPSKRRGSTRSAWLPVAAWLGPPDKADGYPD